MQLSFKDRTSIAILKWRNILGYFKSKYFIRTIGDDNLIDLTVQYLQPSNILVGNNIEIKAHSTLDARSHEINAIRIGDNTRIKENVAIVVYSGSIHIGKNVLIGRNCTLFGHGGILISDYTMISPNCIIVASNHFFALNGINFQDQGFTKEPINIGKNVWIGANTSILGGSFIEDNVVVGAGSVVSSKLESGFLYAGVPAKKIRKIRENEYCDLSHFYKDWDNYKIQNI